MKKNSNKLCKHQNNSKQSILVILSQERCYTLLFFFRVEIILIHLISVTKVKQSNFWQNQWPEIYLTPKAKKHIFFLAKKKHNFCHQQLCDSTGYLKKASLTDKYHGSSLSIIGNKLLIINIFLQDWLILYYICICIYNKLFFDMQNKIFSHKKYINILKLR